MQHGCLSQHIDNMQRAGLLSATPTATEQPCRTVKCHEYALTNIRILFSTCEIACMHRETTYRSCGHTRVTARSSARPLEWAHMERSNHRYMRSIERSVVPMLRTCKDTSKLCYFTSQPRPRSHGPCCTFCKPCRPPTMLPTRAIATSGIRKHAPAHPPRCRAVLQGVYRHGQQCRHSASDGLYCRKHARMAEQVAAEEEAIADKCTLCFASKPKDTFLPCTTCNQELHLPCLLKWHADGGVVKCPFCNAGLSTRAIWYVTKGRLRTAVETRADGLSPEVGWRPPAAYTCLFHTYTPAACIFHL